MKKYILALACNLPLLCSFSLGALPSELKEEIHHLVKSNPHQLSQAEYELIVEKVVSKAPCNMLVFGVGRDSSLWIKVNSHGTTVFLEDSPTWLNRISQQIPEINVHLVTYNTKRRQWRELLVKNLEEELYLEIPKVIAETKWDIIFVDGPQGWGDDTPGRMKSIYTAAKLAHSSHECHVFVHDCERRVEAIYTKTYLYTENLISTQDRLHYYYIP